jgi:hypothetical protein
LNQGYSRNLKATATATATGDSKRSPSIITQLSTAQLTPKSMFLLLLLIGFLILANLSLSSSRRRIPSDLITSPTTSVPEIDIAILADAFQDETRWPSSSRVANSNTDPAVLKVIYEIDSALQEYGLFVATGLEYTSLRDSALTASYSLFASSKDAKSAVALSTDSDINFGRGYLGFGAG